MNVLVIGRNGQLAQCLAAVAVRFPTLKLNFAGRPDLDLAIPGSATAAIHQGNFDLVVNAAAYTQVDRAESEPDQAFCINASAAGEIGFAADRSGAGVIHISTDYVFDGRSGVPYDEEAPVNPLNVYGRSKLAGEDAIRADCPRHVIVRTSWLVSPFGQNFVQTMLRLSDERDEISVVADQFGRPTAVPELAAALLGIAERWNTVKFGTYNIAGGGDPASWADVADLVMDARRSVVSNAPVIRRIRTDEYPTAAERPRYSVLDCMKAQRYLGIASPDWRESVAKIARDVLVKAKATA